LPKFLMLHKYEGRETSKVVGFLGGLTDKARTGKLPSGIRLLEFHSCVGENMNYAVWEAPSKDSLETALRQMNPPGQRTLHELRQAYP